LWRPSGRPGAPELLWGAARPDDRYATKTDAAIAGRPLVRYPEKTDLILLTSPPPQLETPKHYFDRAITPNEAFFVRYHIFPIPTSVDLATWRLKLTGVVEKPLELSMDDLMKKFEKVSLVAVNQCSGNGRSRFVPRVFGGQWGDGAMAMPNGRERDCATSCLRRV
jgi:DMSO/TMAO reductase YedYZ molybdopterin-dependent catalytic subunit